MQALPHQYSSQQSMKSVLQPLHTPKQLRLLLDPQPPIYMAICAGFRQRSSESRSQYKLAADIATGCTVAEQHAAATLELHEAALLEAQQALERAKSADIWRLARLWTHCFRMASPFNCTSR